MKTTTPTPHDALFKQFLTHPETAKDLLDIHLPATLREICDLTTLKLESGSFIEESLRPYYSDVLYSLKTSQGEGYVYALIEHQSRPDKNMTFRLMRYAIAAMQQHMDAGHKHLPLVIPLQFYHGNISPYPYDMNWLKGFANPDQAKALYTQDFPLVDVTVISDDDIMQHRRIALLELVQKHARHRDIMDFLEPLVTLLLTDYTTDKQVQSLMSYLLQVGETNNLEALITSLASSVPKHEETLMTIAEQLRQQGEQRGRQEGIQLGEARGRQEGRQETLNEMARKMMLNGMDQQAIIDVTGLSKDELAQLSH
ncbi:recombination-promoting nuclease RpnB [Vibrio crassostreae]|uniref:Rpn family recombination-promoting nuclease/putative transposase n=1 Tax=Vibrio crassostreae TaxID=246167 RepID=UPI0005E9724A|nr:Rpn family recombination-promoting nuclease/putative transposase [Vibrio crassostreae]CAK1772115.1 recombination-promoting nuclease RpnB [Vibrio crassostreae]CAK1786793.1 recombination-promoting nuclease RpnB [Vibrio crassostreae]CAK1791449.1 recombination-promoting nuclease RpnB [Vibrio crassostreae]CAK2599887.1 recombination-promoting nuclease RpnB [Vibrio crassostreae]CAK2713437.1 recombination-promoting nuclease RpnB [Vibrio crassostreae]